MQHLGDVTKIDGRKAPTVDVIIGGSPCQDLSVAGKRAGLSGERSCLFLEQIRIVREMREESARNASTADAVRPRYMVWENVPGAFSSNGGEDFREVLQETLRIVSEGSTIPRPSGGGGLLPERLWEINSPSLGEYSTRSFGECPKVVVGSRLSQILEDNPHPKYYLSAKACRGILRRAKLRGKELPPVLEETLKMQSGLTICREREHGDSE